MSFWVAGAAVVGTIGGALIASDAAGDASDAQTGAASDATGETARQFNQTRTDLAPWRTAGAGAVNTLARTFGLPTAGTPGQLDRDAYLRDNPDVAADPWASRNAQAHWDGWGSREGRASPMVGGTAPTAGGSPDMSGFFTSPGYDFRRNEGTRGIERTAAARGGAFSGNALRALSEFNSGLASQEFGNWFNQLSGIAGTGQTATESTGAFGANAANSAGRNALFAGDARASGIENEANIIGQGINGLAGIAGYYGQNRSGLQPYSITGAASRRM